MTSQSATAGPGSEPGDRGRELLVGHVEALTVTMLEVDAVPQVSGDPLDVQRVDGSRRSSCFPDRARSPRLS